MSESPLWLSPLQPSARLRAIEVGDRLVLFHDRRQCLYDLNETAAVIWHHVASGLPCSEIATRLCAGGIAQTDAGTFTAAAVTDWLREGFVTPLEVGDRLQGTTSAARRLAIGPLALGLSFFGTDDPDAAFAPFAHFAVSGTDARREIAIVSHVGHDFVFSGGEPVGMCAPRQTVPALKSLITAEYCEAVSNGFVTHGGLISADGRTVFLCGAPGAGKSTLTLALTSRGFAYGTDDIIHINGQGLAAGVPFAAAAKSTSWDLLRPYLPQLEALPSYERADAQVTRYVLPERRDQAGPRPIDIALQLERKPGAKAHFEPVPPLEMLCVVLDAGYAARRAIDPVTLERLAHHLTHARSYRFVYDDLADAVAAMEGLVHE